MTKSGAGGCFLHACSVKMPSRWICFSLGHIRRTYGYWPYVRICMYGEEFSFSKGIHLLINFLLKRKLVLIWIREKTMMRAFKCLLACSKSKGWDVLLQLIMFGIMVGTRLCCDFFSPPFFPQSFTFYKMHEFYLPQKNCQTGPYII